MKSQPTVHDGPTKGGSYFVSNYPPFAYWSSEAVHDVLNVLRTSPGKKAPLGLYAHIPFCRKRCHFCYFKVYTGRNSTEVRAYIDAMIEEMRQWSQEAFLRERTVDFIYFGGGTPSYLSAELLDLLHRSLRTHLPWAENAEIAFECEPGTLSLPKLKTIREMGCTRLSIGIESFDDEILMANGRAHRAKDIDESYDMARNVGFPQINIDLIAGMAGETDASWTEGIEKALAMNPESLTIYQMELPYNTDFSRQLREGLSPGVADWAQKRRWVASAFEAFEAAGYKRSSGYTLVHPSVEEAFRYRDALWHGADMLGIGVSSFSHVQGTHFQNEKDLDIYMERIANQELPLQRGFSMTEEHRLIREFILQLKLGRVETPYFQEKFGVDIRERFGSSLNALSEDGLIRMEDDAFHLSNDALLRVDALLPAFYLPEHGGPARDAIGEDREVE